MSLRDNVLFGHDMPTSHGGIEGKEEGKEDVRESISLNVRESSKLDSGVRACYHNAIRAAALEPDLGILSQGDLTEIGEIARVSLRLHQAYA